jgi:hypothetical protein
MGVEGMREGRPVLMRIRSIPSSFVGIADLPFAFVLVWKYVPVGPTGLPSEEDYDQTEVIERDVIDVLESGAEGILAFTRTWNGSVKYVCYVKDPDEMAKLVNDRVPESLQLELTAGEDRKWSEYSELLRDLPGNSKGSQVE